MKKKQTLDPKFIVAVGYLVYMTAKTVSIVVLTRKTLNAVKQTMEKAEERIEQAIIDMQFTEIIRYNDE